MIELNIPIMNTPILPLDLFFCSTTYYKYETGSPLPQKEDGLLIEMFDVSALLPVGVVGEMKWRLQESHHALPQWNYNPLNPIMHCSDGMIIH